MTSTPFGLRTAAALLVLVVVATSACSPRSSTLPTSRATPLRALSLPDGSDHPTPQPPFDERPVTPFETVGASVRD